ncbi:MAG: hypothetical protein A2X45_14545 [Lentisphaerae bacterium GWF2_50_93]|nr:MAG: hypothetical protein A2X45_14545 [Lentisphaerae bacterium GWF2_50_93]
MLICLAVFSFNSFSQDDDARLKALGERVKEGERLELANRKEFNDKVSEIRSDNSLSTSEKQARINKEYSTYREKSQKLTVEYRKPAQDELARIANAAEGAGTTETSKKFKETAGTKMGDAEHRGWTGDTDAGAGARTTDKLIKAAEKMGLPVNKSPKGPGYVNIGGLDLTVHTEGAMGRPGTEAHYVQISADARSKETYVSAGMKDKQAGKALVETNDHIKKAMEGVELPHQELLTNPEKLQIMAKGTTKAVKSSGLTNARIEKILKNNGIQGTPEDFMRMLGETKAGKAIAPDAVGLNSKNINKAQDACREILAESQFMAERKAKIEFAAKQQQIKDLIGRGEHQKAQAIKDDLFDSYVRIKETNKVVGGKLPPSTSGIPDQPSGISQAAKAKILFGVGTAFTGYASWNEEAEAAKAEKRTFSQANVVKNFAGNMTGITNAVNQSKAVYNELAVKNYEYLDSQFDALGDTPNVSTARILMITAKSTLRTATKATWEGVKGLPLFIGDIASAAENTVMLGTASTGLLYDSINAQMTVQDNKEWQAVTLERGLIAIKKWKIFLFQAADEIKRKEAFLRSSEGMLNSRDQIIDIKYNTEGNIKNLEALCIQADSLRTDREKFIKGNAESRLVKLFGEVKKKADSNFEAAGKMLQQIQLGKITPDEVRKQGGALKEEFLKNEDAYVKGAEELVDLGKFADASELLKTIDSFRTGIEKSLADANRLASATKDIVPSYKKVGSEIIKDFEAYQGFKNELNRKIDFFMDKYAKVDSPHYKDLDEIKNKIAGLDVKKPDKEAIDSSCEQLSKMSKTLADIEKIKIPDVKTQLKADEADLMGQMLANMEKAANDAEASIRKARDEIAKLNLDFEGIKIMIAVVDSATGTQIDGATVSVSSKKYNAKNPVRDGVAEFGDVPAGEYQVQASADGYDSKGITLTVDSVSGKDISGSVKLTANKQSAVRAAEQKKEDKELERKVEQVRDADLEKAKDIIGNVSSMATQGKYLTRHTLFTDNSTSIAYSLEKMAGLKSKSDSIQIILLLGDVSEFYKRGSDLGLAYVIEKVSYWLKNQDYDEYQSLARMKCGIKGTFTSPTEMSKTALAFVDFDLKMTEEFTLNVSNMLWYMNYKEYQDRKIKSAVKEGKPSQLGAVEFWSSLIVSGGYQAVSAELDKFWAGPAKDCIKGDAAKDFDKKNPYIVKDYRDRYIVMEIAPLLEKWSAEKRLAREKEFVVAANEVAGRLAQAAVNIRGTIKTAPESLPCKVRIANGKQEYKQDSVNFNKSLKELESESFEISADPVKDSNIYNASGKRFSFNLNPRYTSISQVALKVNGYAIDIEVPAINVPAYKIRKDEFDSNDKNLVKVPPPPVEKNQEYSGNFNAALSGFSSNTVSLQESERRHYIVSSAFDAYKYDLSNGYSRTLSAMRHNYDVENRKDIPYEQKKQVVDALNGRIKAVEAEAAKLSKQCDEIGKLANDSLNKSRTELSRKETELTKKTQAINKDKMELFKTWYNATSKFSKVFDEVKYISSYSQSSRESVIKDYMNPEALSPDFDGKFQKLKGGTIQNFTVALNEIYSYEAKFEALKGRLDAAIKEADALQLQRYGKDPLELSDGSRHYSYNTSGPGYDVRQVEEALDFIRTVKEIHLENKLKNDLSRIDWYLGKRGGAIQNLEAMIVEMEKLATQLPDQSKIAEAEAEIKPVAGKLEEYAKAITSAVMSRNVRNFKVPQGCLTPKAATRLL